MRSGIEGAHHAKCEASVEAKGWEKIRTGVGSRRPVPVCGRRFRNDRGTGRRRDGDAEHHAQSAGHPWRRGSVRRQSGDVLCLRQGNHQVASRHRADGPIRLRRVPRLRRLPWMPRMRTRLLRLPRLRLRRVRRLLVFPLALVRLLGRSICGWHQPWQFVTAVTVDSNC
jgi:hypothetical protein